MYSKQQASQLKQTFWTSLGQYMAPIASAEGEKINWINYKTGIKDVYFKMQADANQASIGIVLLHHDTSLQQLFFSQFVAVKKILEVALQEEWMWALHEKNEGTVRSRIFTELQGVSIFNKEHWPSLISFFKPRLIALDEFWSSAKYSFEGLY